MALPVGGLCKMTGDRMKRFKSLLVGVDLSRGDRYVSDELVPPTEEAVQRALWLARTNSASVLFFYSLDIPVTAV